ncbi:hypothetical protein APS47_02580 [Leptospira kirschneri serovar Mozdok]|nr:hypothetical protein APS47_02580 [Leptospira kirschneri serovar Mozdok]
MWKLILLENSFSFFLRPAHVKYRQKRVEPIVVRVKAIRRSEDSGNAASKNYIGCGIDDLIGSLTFRCSFSQYSDSLTPRNFWYK